MGRIIESLTLDGKNTEFEEFCDDCGPNQKRWVLICFSITVKMFAHNICGYDYILLYEKFPLLPSANEVAER